jgi:hypothetical protein
MVDRCPNCGQTVRPSARFCTSCGFRLPEQAPVEQPPTVGRSPFATTSTVSPWWQPTQRGEAPAETPSAPAMPQESEAAAAGVEAATAEAAPSSAPEVLPQEAEAPAAEAVPEAAEAVPAPEEVPAWESHVPAGEEFEAPPVSERSLWEETVAEVTALRQRHEAVALGEAGVAEAGEPLQRAEELLDQLRALLPQLAARGTVVVDPEAVAAGLEAAREELAMKRATFDTLGEVAERARAHPRDLDVMLDLVARAEDIIALKAAYTRALAAIDDALAALRKR